MYENIITFPGLGLKFEINPIAFSIFGIEIRWYGVIISIAFLLGFLLALYNAKKQDFNIEYIYDVVLISTPFAIIFARLYYVVFNFDFYKGNIKEILSIRHGGLAIYGGIIGSLISAFIYSKIKKISLLKLLDICAPSLILGQAIGRWGNFINQEAYGTQTDLPWRMGVYDINLNKRIEVHPTFLYESVWNFIVFIILFLFFNKKRRFDGQIFLYYIILYALGRFFIEGLRTDSLMIGNYRISQVVSIILFILGIVLLIYKNYRHDSIK
ncbi:prolipoprotein diacylglyceryl transferase [Caldicellulosiruptoraceae bacterium PP1]